MSCKTNSVERMKSREKVLARCFDQAEDHAEHEEYLDMAHALNEHGACRTR